MILLETPSDFRTHDLPTRVCELHSQSLVIVVVVIVETEGFSFDSDRYDCRFPDFYFDERRHSRSFEVIDRHW